MKQELTPRGIMGRMDVAFGTVPYPGDGALLTLDSLAGQHLCTGLRGRPPGAVSDDFIAQHFIGLTLLSAEARRHYLPAWMRITLRRPGSDVAAFVLYVLSGDLWWRYEGGFSKAQREVIADFLEFACLHLKRPLHSRLSDAIAMWRSPSRVWQGGEVSASSFTPDADTACVAAGMPRDLESPAFPL